MNCISCVYSEPFLHVVTLMIDGPSGRRSKEWSRADRLRSDFESHRGMNVRLLRMLCVVRYRSLRQADHSTRGVLPNLVRRYVRSRNLVNEEALAHWGLLQKKKKKL
jgi:hypothetical protein